MTEDRMDIDAGETVAPAVAPKKGGWPKGKPRAPRAGAEVLTATQAEAARPPVRERKRKGGSNVDRFSVPAGMIPPGQSWEWKRATTFGKGDAAYDAFLYDQGWLPVEQSRYPNFPMQRDGMILMERPIELTREARAEERAAARDAVIQKERQLFEAGEGEFARKGVQVSTTIERGIPVE